MGLHGRAGLLGPLYVLLMHCDFSDEQPLQCRCEFLDVHVVLDLSMVCEMLVCCGGQRRVCRSKVKPAPTAAEHTAIPGMRPRRRCRMAMINWKDPPSRGGRRSPAAPGREDLPARRLDGGHSPLVSFQAAKQREGEGRRFQPGAPPFSSSPPAWSRDGLPKTLYHLPHRWSQVQHRAVHRRALLLSTIVS